MSWCCRRESTLEGCGCTSTRDDAQVAGNPSPAHRREPHRSHCALDIVSMFRRWLGRPVGHRSRSAVLRSQLQIQYVPPPVAVGRRGRCTVEEVYCSDGESCEGERRGTLSPCRSTGRRGAWSLENRVTGPCISVGYPWTLSPPKTNRSS